MIRTNHYNYDLNAENNFYRTQCNFNSQQTLTSTMVARVCIGRRNWPLFGAKQDRRERVVLYGQLIFGLNGMYIPDGLFSYNQTCRLQCGAGTGVPPMLNAWPANVGAGCPTFRTIYSSAMRRSWPPGPLA